MAGLSLCVLLGAGLVAWTGARDEDAGRYVAPSPTAAPAAVDGPGAALTLQRLVRALDERDRDAAVALAAPDDNATATVLGNLVDAAGAARLTDLSLRYIDDNGGVAADGTWAASVEVSWAFEGFDETTTTAEVQVRFRSNPAGVAVAGIGGGAFSTPVWMSGPVRVSRNRRVMVLSVEDDPAPYMRAAQAALPTVQRVLASWRPRLVVEVPSNDAALEQLLGMTPGYYAQIAAVAGSSGATEPAAPIHIFVNPDVFNGLGRIGQDVVLAHEATHVATNAPLSQAPTWLVEGFADYVALRDKSLPRSRTAAQIVDQVRKEGLPKALPTPNEFDPARPRLGAAYEGSWLLCVTLAARAGELALARFYRRVSRGNDVSTVLQDVYRWSEDDLLKNWRDLLRRLVETVS